MLEMFPCSASKNEGFDDQPRTKAGHRRKMWPGVALVLSGVAAFITGIFCFAPAATPPVAVSAPDAITDPGSQVKALKWTQVKPIEVIEVEVSNGLSKAKTTTLAAAAPSKEPVVTPPKIVETPATPTPFAGIGRMTRDNFELIQSGMTEHQVTAIFGPPNGTTTKRGTINGHPFLTKGLMWRQDNHRGIHLTITVTLRDEKVSGKNWIQIGPRAVAAPAGVNR